MRNTVIPLLLTVLYSAPLWAESDTSSIIKKDTHTQWYQVDIIVFKNNIDGKTTSEKWPQTHFTPPSSGAIKLSDPHRMIMPDIYNTLANSEQHTPEEPNLQRDPFIALPAADQALNKEASALSTSPDYTILAKMAWRLPVNPNQKEQPVFIESPINNDSLYMLNGTIAVSLNRFLHVDVDLWYNQLIPASLPVPLIHKPVDTSASTPTIKNNHLSFRIIKSFQLKERKRIQKTSEVQYLDSPVIGVLLKLSPYQPPESEYKPLFHSIK